MRNYTIIFQLDCYVPNAVLENVAKMSTTETHYQFFDAEDELVGMVTLENVLMITTQTAPFRNVKTRMPEAAPLLRPDDPLPTLEGDNVKVKTDEENTPKGNVFEDTIKDNPGLATILGITVAQDQPMNQEQLEQATKKIEDKLHEVDPNANVGDLFAMVGIQFPTADNADPTPQVAEEGVHYLQPMDDTLPQIN